MSRSIVRCRCGHQVLSKEVLRTDLYERSAGREYVYIKYRCAHCKRMGQAFVPEHRWDWTMLEAARNEMSATERDHFLDVSPISESEISEFHAQLETVETLTEWNRQANAGPTGVGQTGAGQVNVGQTDAGQSDAGQAAPSNAAGPPRPENARPENIRKRPIGEENSRKSPNPSPNKGSNGENSTEDAR